MVHRISTELFDKTPRNQNNICFFIEKIKCNKINMIESETIIIGTLIQRIIDYNVQ